MFANHLPPEAADGDELRPARARVAPGDYYMLMRKRAAGYFVEVKSGARVNYQRPFVDALFSFGGGGRRSARHGRLLTGMGSDGAEGLLKMRRPGARTVTQDQATCAIFGAAQSVLALDRIAGEILPERKRLAERRTA
jgi:two-component system, chemotaxis family, protein-glutamate methylesterase/glutaminase